MIFDYGFSLIGKSHIAKGNCCQDNHKIKKMDNGWYIAAIADGVGSAENSQIGSRIATETVVAVCEEYMPWDYSVISIKSMMRTAYNYAYKQILREAERTGNPVESYDTTLSMVIYDGHRIIYGHSGDGAIIGLNTFGDYVEITKPQKGVDGVAVLPLRAGYTQWKIDNYDEELVAVLLVTDGMLDILCPYLLKDLENKIDKIYVPLASYFADPIGISDKQSVLIKKEIEQFVIADEKYDYTKFYDRLTNIYKSRAKKEYKDILELIKKNHYPIAMMQNVQDDKTVVGLINTDVLVENRDEQFYSEPDWVKLQEAWNRKAYPHLYADMQDSVDNDAVVSFHKVFENEKTKQAIQAYGKASTPVPKRVTPMQRGTSEETEEKKDILMEKHEKPRKKSIIDKIGDVLN